MELEELVKETALALGAEYSVDEGEKKVFTITLTYDDDVKEKVFIYQDVYENEDAEQVKKLIAAKTKIV